MTKKEVYRLRTILEEMKYIKEADTDKTATHVRFLKIYDEGHLICENEINKRTPLE